MAYQQFTKDQYFVVSVDNKSTEVCNFILGTATKLQYLILTLFKVGAHAGTETLQVHVYGNVDAKTPLASSAVVAMSDIDTLTASNWAGRVRFDFNRQNLDADNTYYIGVQVNNYTYAAGSYYWAWALDWPDDINIPANAITRGVQFSLIGYDA